MLGTVGEREREHAVHKPQEADRPTGAGPAHGHGDVSEITTHAAAPRKVCPTPAKPATRSRTTHGRAGPPAVKSGENTLISSCATSGARRREHLLHPVESAVDDDGRRRTDTVTRQISPSPSHTLPMIAPATNAASWP